MSVFSSRSLGRLPVPRYRAFRMPAKLVLSQLATMPRRSLPRASDHVVRVAPTDDGGIVVAHHGGNLTLTQDSYHSRRIVAVANNVPGADYLLRTCTPAALPRVHLPRCHVYTCRVAMRTPAALPCVHLPRRHVYTCRVAMRTPAASPRVHLRASPPCGANRLPLRSLATAFCKLRWLPRRQLG